jgi:hypothetical protein
LERLDIQNDIYTREYQGKDIIPNRLNLVLLERRASEREANDCPFCHGKNRFCGFSSHPHVTIPISGAPIAMGGITEKYLYDVKRMLTGKALDFWTVNGELAFDLGLEMTLVEHVIDLLAPLDEMPYLRLLAQRIGLIKADVDQDESDARGRGWYLTYPAIGLHNSSIFFQFEPEFQDGILEEISEAIYNEHRKVPNRVRSLIMLPVKDIVVVKEDNGVPGVTEVLYPGEVLELEDRIYRKYAEYEELVLEYLRTKSSWDCSFMGEAESGLLRTLNEIIDSIRKTHP